MQKQNLHCYKQYFEFNNTISKRRVFLGEPEAGPKVHAEKPKEVKPTQAEADRKISRETGKPVKEIQAYREKYLMPLEKVGITGLKDDKEVYKLAGLRDKLALQVVPMQKRYDELVETAKKLEGAVETEGKTFLAFESAGFTPENVDEAYSGTDSYNKARHEYHSAVVKLQTFAMARNTFENSLWNLETLTQTPHPPGTEKGPIKYEPQSRDFSELQGKIDDKVDSDLRDSF